MSLCAVGSGPATLCYDQALSGAAELTITEVSNNNFDFLSEILILKNGEMIWDVKNVLTGSNSSPFTFLVCFGGECY